jgi:hypothetical protein
VQAGALLPQAGAYLTPIPRRGVLKKPGIGFFITWWITYTNSFWTLGVISLIISTLWTIWIWADWQNDYYIVTNQRVIWLEKVIGIYDSRQEANLDEILSVSTNTDAITQSIFNYGKMTVRIMVGGIEFDFTPHPHQAKYLIEELQQRTKIAEKKLIGYFKINFVSVSNLASRRCYLIANHALFFSGFCVDFNTVQLIKLSII